MSRPGSSSAQRRDVEGTCISMSEETESPLTPSPPVGERSSLPVVGEAEASEPQGSSEGVAEQEGSSDSRFIQVARADLVALCEAILGPEDEPAWMELPMDCDYQPTCESWCGHCGAPDGKHEQYCPVLVAQDVRPRLLPSQQLETTSLIEMPSKELGDELERSLREDHGVQ